MDVDTILHLNDTLWCNFNYGSAYQMLEDGNAQLEMIVEWLCWRITLNGSVVLVSVHVSSVRQKQVCQCDSFTFIVIIKAPSAMYGNKVICMVAFMFQNS